MTDQTFKHQAESLGFTVIEFFNHARKRGAVIAGNKIPTGELLPVLFGQMPDDGNLEDLLNKWL